MNVHAKIQGAALSGDPLKLAESLKCAFSPGDIATPGTTKGAKNGPEYLLAKSEWAAIQAYVNNALVLPVTDAQFRVSIGAPSDFKLDDFQKLINCYQDINGHAKNWQDVVFPATLNLASSVYQYGTQKVPVYYPAITQVADQLAADPCSDMLKNKLKALIQNVRDSAQGYADDAKRVFGQVSDFANATLHDRDRLVGPDGLEVYYEKKYGTTSSKVKELTDQIKAETAIARGAMDEYNKDVTIAATTPTYAWIFPFGTIASAVVAGVYGSRATDALKRAREAQKMIDTLSKDLQLNANLVNYLHFATASIAQISEKLMAALPYIQTLQGAWGAMADDLGSILEIIDKDITKVPPIIASIGVNEACLAWASVAAAADAYRKNAYISVDIETAVMQSTILGHAA